MSFPFSLDSGKDFFITAFICGKSLAFLLFILKGVKNFMPSASVLEQKKKIVSDLTERMKKDLCNFEGNAQALRILSKIKHNPMGYDMNLTYSAINTLIKYPTNLP